MFASLFFFPVLLWVCIAVAELGTEFPIVRLAVTIHGKV